MAFFQVVHTFRGECKMRFHADLSRDRYDPEVSVTATITEADRFIIGPTTRCFV
jgi:hypothetical protein